MKVSFTGTRHGMTGLQRRALRTELSALFPTNSEENHVFVHGDCIGADAQVHDMVRRYFPWVSITSRPSNKPGMRAYRQADMEHTPHDPLVRNQSIVRDGDLLIACPAECSEQSRGGTWFTVRKARIAKKRIVIVWPNGTVKEEGTK